MAESVVKSAARVLEVLEFFAARRVPATVGEVGRALRYPQSSASVLLQSLLSLGYLAHDGATRRYTPTPRVMLLGAWLKPADGVAALLERLHAATGETVILAQQSTIYAQYIQILEANSPLRLHLRIGTLRPLTRAAVGRALLSLKSDAEILRIVRRCNALDPLGPIPQYDVLRAVSEVRAHGWTMTANTVTQGAGVIAALLPGSAGGPVLAIGIGAPIERLRQRRPSILAALAGAAPAIQPPRRTA